MPASHRDLGRRDLVRKAFGVVETEALGERQIRVVVSTGQIDRSGDVVVQDGIDCANFKRSRTVLWNHDQDHPVAQCTEIGIKDSRLEATAQFPPQGVSAKADEVYGLLKAGVINAASIGFLPLDVEPVDGRNPRKGLRIGASELMEFSFVSVPANSGAEVLQRALRGRETKAAPKLSIKGLYAVAQLARLLDMLGWQVEASLAERAREGDASDVPDQLSQALNQLGTALVAMTSEEVAELLAGKDGDADSLCPDVDDGPMLLALIDGLRTKAGRKISALTDDAMRGHLAKVAEGCAMAQAGHGAIVKMLNDAKGDEGDCNEMNDEVKVAVAAQTQRMRELETLRLA